MGLRGKLGRVRVDMHVVKCREGYSTRAGLQDTDRSARNRSLVHYRLVFRLTREHTLQGVCLWQISLAGLVGAK
jgi:hypothetical protein